MRKISMCTKRWFDSLSLVAQNVEENECRRAHDMAVETYSQSFNKQTPLDEVSLQEAQEEAVQAALTVYNSEAVGGGPTRQKYEKQLHSNLKRQFEVIFQRRPVSFSVFQDGRWAAS
jgi:hypothetical protein